MTAKQVPSFLLPLVLFSSQVIATSAKPSNRIKSLNIIKELNRKGPYIGLVAVFSTEEDAFFAAGAFRPHPMHLFVDLSGIYFLHQCLMNL